MEIKGNTIIFKSTDEFYFKEESGTKPNTIRRFDLEEEAAMDFKNKFQEEVKYIEIYNRISPHLSFKRQLRDISTFKFSGEDQYIFVFSWFHEDEPTRLFVRQKLIDWLENGNTGASSISLWYLLMRINVTHLHAPYDSADFVRCYNLLQLVDEPTKQDILLKAGLIEPMWKSFSCAWKLLETLYKDGEIIELERAIKKLRE